MKFSIDPADLKEAVRFAQTAIAGRPAYPVLAGVLIEASGSRMLASGTDELRVARVHVPATVESEGSVLLHASSLAKAVSKLKSRTGVIIQEDGAKIRFAQGKMKFTLPKMPIEEYPQKIEGDLKVIGHVNGEAFSKLITSAEVATSKDDALPALGAVNLELSHEVAALGTDRYRLAMDTIEWEPIEECSHRLNVSSAWLKNVAKNIAGDTALLITQEKGLPNRIGIVSGNYSASSTVIAGDYPKIRALFTNRARDEHLLDRQGLIDALDFVGVMSERNAPVRISGRDGVLTFEAGGAEGESTTELTSDCYEPFEIGLNPSLALDLLRVIDTEKIRFVPNGSKPIYITPIEGNTEYLLMPVRLPQQ